MTLTYAFDPVRVKINNPVKYLGQRSFHSTIIALTRTVDRLLRPDHKMVSKCGYFSNRHFVLKCRTFVVNITNNSEVGTLGGLDCCVQCRGGLSAGEG